VSTLGSIIPNELRAELSALDAALYVAVASTKTPSLDSFFRGLSRASDRSVLWLGVAGVMAAVGGPKSRQAALGGVVSIGLASAVVNIGAKRAFRRTRPDRARSGVPFGRHVTMPTSTSFPSGHSASAFAFAEGVANTQPALGAAVRVLAFAVAYSRVHTGVHYPADVAAGVMIGTTAGEIGPRLTMGLGRYLSGGHLRPKP
jgi:membrane-associated phospholipid phosphatase